MIPSYWFKEVNQRSVARRRTMAKNHSTGIVRVNESEIRDYLDRQVREAVKQVLEEIMSTEAEELLCAGPYECSEERTDLKERQEEAQAGRPA